VQDGVRPAAVVLGVDLIGTHSVTVTMEAPGDDSLSRQATTYDLRYSTLQINSDSRWQSASQEFGEPSPGNPGSETFLTADSLQLCTTYYFAVKTRDEAGNWSGLSNSPSAKTLCSGGGFAGETSEHAHLADTGIGHSRPASADVRLSSARDSEVRGLTQSRLVLSEDFDGQNRVFKILRMPEADADDSCSTRDPHAFMWLNSTEHERNVCPPSYVPSAETQLIGVARAARAGTRLVLPLGASVQSIAPTLAIETSDGLTELHFVTLTDQRESSTDSPDSARSIIEALVVGDTLTLSYARSAGRTVVDDRWSVLVTLPESSARQSESSQSGQSLAVPKR
jgi:hypothetical protein